jgi:hypothetical protein
LSYGIHNWLLWSLRRDLAQIIDRLNALELQLLPKDLHRSGASQSHETTGRSLVLATSH